jgi:glycosyltransferase involved in cell wall biosynthesis
LTVAIPTFDGARHLRDALRGILAQSGSSYDVLICDDRSDDETVSIVRAEAGDRARIEVSSERLGLAGNWNRCVRSSRTPLVTVFHQDDVMYAGHLAAHVAAFDTDEHIGMAVSGADVVDDHGQPVPESVVERGGLGSADCTFQPGELASRMVVANPIRCSAVTLRAAAHADVGGFDPSLRYVLDWDFWLRLSRSWRVAWRATPTVAVRWHAESETHRFKTGTTDLDEIARLQDRVLAEDGCGWSSREQLRRHALRRRARAYLNRAHDALNGGDEQLARRSLAEAVRIWPGVLGTIALDPRLAARMAALVAAPRLAKRWLSKDGIRDSRP